MNDTQKYNEIKKIVRKMGKEELYSFILDSPVKVDFKDFVFDSFFLSISDLSEKYNISQSGVSARKKREYCKLYDFRINNLGMKVKTNEEIENELLLKRTELDIRKKEIDSKLVKIELEKEIQLKKKELEEKEKELNRKLRIVEKENQKNERKKNPSWRDVKTKGSLRKERISKAALNKHLRQTYIPMYVRGEITNKQAAEYIGITPTAVSRLKKRYLEEGDACFINKNVGKVSNKRTPETIVKQVVEIYKSQYFGTSFNMFRDLLEINHNISLSYNSVRHILNANNIESQAAPKYNRGKTNDTSDFKELMSILEGSLIKKEFTLLEEFGIIYVCELAFDKSWQILKKQLFINERKEFRTSFSTINYLIEYCELNIKNEWEYWQSNHQFFTFCNYSDIRKRVINDIRLYYFPMFEKIKDYLCLN